MKKFALILLTVFVGVLVGREMGKLSATEQLAQVVATPTVTRLFYEPEKIVIEKLKISASIEKVGLDNDRNMDVPKDTDNVAWYELGSKPGQIGNSVIAGHYDDNDGPSVFFNLNSLNVGDLITIVDSESNELVFTVTDKQLYNNNHFPIDAVFGPTSHRRLNLITCEGVYGPKGYDQRLVIYSELVD